MQFKTGDKVIYSGFGLCVIKNIKPMSFSSDRPKEDYLVLYPVSNPSSTFYVPEKSAQTEIRMPLNKDEILSLLEKAKKSDAVWTDNRQIRSDKFRAILSKGVSEELIALLNCLYCRREELQQQNKNLSFTDEAVFSNAEKLLHEEFAYSLKINKSEVNRFISDFFQCEQ